jgi:plasmid replication initiation protein
MELKEHAFELSDFCRVCGLDSDNGANYRYIKKTLKELRDKSVWVEIEKGTEATLAWISTVIITKGSGVVRIRIDDMMKPYLIQLRERFTQFELYYTLAMRSQYSIRLYELLKSYEHRQSKTFEIEELKKRLDAETYERFTNFQQKVLDIAIREINELSDINVTYTLAKEGRRFAKIRFVINIKKDLTERMEAWRQIELQLGGKNKKRKKEEESLTPP